MLKQDKKTEEWIIDGPDDLDEVAAAIEERKASIEEIEKMAEAEYDYLTLKEEVVSLSAAMTNFMARFDVAHVFRDTYKITLIKRGRSTWNAEKLKSLVPKPIWLKITKLVVDPDKIDDLVRAGKLDQKKIAAAYETKTEKPHTRIFPYSDGQDKDAARDEEAALRAAMSGGTPSKRKKANG